MIYLLRNSITIFLSILLALMPLSSTQAAMIGNDQIINQGTAHQMRDNLKQQFERGIVQQQLQTWGIQKDHIHDRIDSLSGDEVARIYQQINDPQAGGDVLGIVLTILLIFVITDIIGATDIYPFINSVN